MLSTREIAALMKSVAGVVREHVTQVAETLNAKVAQLEQRIAQIPAGADGRDGADGEDVSLEAVAELVAREVAKIPIPKDGKDAEPVDVDQIVAQVQAKIIPAENGKDGSDGKHGRDGKDADPEQIRQLVADAVAKIPAPKDGRDAEPVDVERIAADVLAKIIPPENGKDGKDADPEYVKQLVTESVSKIPAPSDGRHGKSAYDVAVERGFTGTADEWLASLRGVGLKGDAGNDGRSFTIDDVRSLLEAEQAKWALEFERRAHDTLQRAIDRMPVAKDGRDGVDGLGFEDLSVEFDGERTAVVKFARNGVEKAFPLRLPAVIDRGVYKEASEYERGDGATYGGSFWIAQKDHPGKPGDGDGWRLAVKRGRDGKDGERGDKGEPGKPGQKGDQGLTLYK